MLNFLKPKRNAAEQGIVFANAALNLWMKPGPQTQADIHKMIEMGCHKDRLCIEITAFTIFSTWYGMSMAQEQRRLSEPIHEILQDSFFSQLRLLTEAEPLSIGVSVSYDSLGELLFARLEHYLFLNACDSASEGREKAISYLCDFICDDDPSSNIKFYLLSFLNLASFKVFDTIGGIRLE